MDPTIDVPNQLVSYFPSKSGAAWSGHVPLQGEMIENHQKLGEEGEVSKSQVFSKFKVPFYATFHSHYL